MAFSSTKRMGIMYGKLFDLPHLANCFGGTFLGSSGICY